MRTTSGAIVRAVRVRWIGIGAFALLFGFVLVLLRGEPWIGGDPGVFLTVAARLLAGDRLYADVFDNKDPLFFYMCAAALWVGGWRGPFMLDAVWFALASVSMALSIRALRAPRSVVVASCLVYPLALAAGWYLVGMSMLGALAVAPLAPWLWLRGRFAAAGAVLVVVLLLKINLVPVAAAPLAALLVLGAPEIPRGRSVLRGALGLGVATVVAAAFLAVRGELRPYLDTIVYNVHYSSARTPSHDAVGRLMDHLRVAWDFFHLSGRWQTPAAILVLVGFLVAVGIAAIRGSRPERLLGGTAIATLVASFLVIALTAYGNEHVQLLAYPATLVAAALIWRADAAWGGSAGAIAATALVLFALWSSLKVPGGTQVSTFWTTDIRRYSGAAVGLDRAGDSYPAEARPMTYMVLGSNSENGHAAFLRRSSDWDLTCRYFHLYDFSRLEQFDETLTCADRERPAFVLVTLGFDDPSGQSPAWDAFRASAQRILRARYERVEEEPPGFQVWRRRST